VSNEVELLTVDEAGARIDAYLASRITDLSRTRIQRAIEDSDILVNDRAVKPSYRVRAGDRIEIDLPDPPPLKLVAEDIPLKIIYEDDDFVVINKPAGMVVHPGAGIESGTLANALLYHFNQLSDSGGQTRPGIVHRIDKETSGLLVVAKNDVAHEMISEQFRDRKVFKLYVALVYGRVMRDRGEIDARIGRSSQNRTRMAVLGGGAGRSALTLFEVSKRFDEFTLLDVQIRTGRTHQIRVHLSHVNHPVVGDSTYGAGRENSVKSPDVRRNIKLLGRHFLHSSRLAFLHPRTGERVEFAAPLPPELTDFLEGLR